MLGSIALAALLACAALPAAGARTTAPVVEAVEPVASDALSGDPRLLANNWGAQQLRITRQADGTLRAVYLRKAGDALEWRLMRRGDDGWHEEAHGPSTDDVDLLRDPASDHVLLLAWPDSVPTLFTAGQREGRRIPGDWQRLTPRQRHYASVGISPQGALCLKTTVPRGDTGHTDWIYTCSRAESGGSAWGPQIDIDIGPRLTYDYLFPGLGAQHNRLAASSQQDLHRSVVGHDSLAAPWVFNGVHLFTTGMSNGDVARQWVLAQPLPIASGATIAPTLKQDDALVDTQGRLLSLSFANDPRNPSVRGFSLAVDRLDGSATATRRLDLPSYGHARLFQDGHERLWLLWMNKGSRQSEVRVYPLIDNDPRQPPHLGSPTDLSRAFAPFAIDGSPYLAVPRGGMVRSSVIDGLVAACVPPYVHGKEYDVHQCYPDGGNSQRVFYFRIRLPD
jgi:hypothetical protein